MSTVRQTLLYCDGLDCPRGGDAFTEGNGTFNAKEQRKFAERQGWVFRCGKDYCPECAPALFVRVPPDQMEMD
jgi:hypothetical protein